MVMTSSRSIISWLLSIVIALMTIGFCEISFAQTPAPDDKTEAEQVPADPKTDKEAKIGTKDAEEESPAKKLLPQGQGQDGPMEVLGRIGERLREVEAIMTRLTFDGDAGEGQQQVIDDIDKLLDQTGSGQRQVLDEIDKLLEMAQEQKCSNFSPQSMSQSQSDRKQQQNKQQEQNEKQDSQSEQNPQNQDGGKPEDANQSEGDPNNPQKPSDPKAEKSWSKNVDGRWGSLPPKLQELIRQGDPSKFPPQYREMLEEYYKRLSDKDT